MNKCDRRGQETIGLYHELPQTFVHIYDDAQFWQVQLSHSAFGQVISEHPEKLPLLQTPC